MLPVRTLFSMSSRAVCAASRAHTLSRSALVSTPSLPIRFFRTSSQVQQETGFKHLPVLKDYSLETFREQCLIPELPAVMAPGVASSLPAFTKWFRSHNLDINTLELDSDYLLQSGDPLVPLELTRSPTNHQGPVEEFFQRFQAPLSLFLGWTASPKDGGSSERLYLAQAPLSDLPQGLQDDLPPPKLVLAGKGDVYNANLWMGLAPTYTPLHRDPNPNLFVQLSGTKVVRLFEPDAGRNIFARVQQQLGQAGSASVRDEGMMQGAEKRLMEQVVWSQPQSKVNLHGSSPSEVHLQRGDAIFIPKGWWHSIKGVGPGITASVSCLTTMC